jgi:Type I phosphodiesterase / nucleotide pyrophosphatase
VLVAAACLGVAGLAHYEALRSWDSVVHYRSPFHFADGEAVAGPRVTHHVVLVVVDGLRLERSRQLKTLNVLRARGADFDCTTSVPSYSRPGRANLATGAWPDVHGVTSNRHRGTLPADNLFRAARRMGESVALAGSTIWPSLFGPDLEGALVLPTTIKEERGAFSRVEPLMQNFEREAARRLASSDARLAVLDLDVPDYAAHEYGARSPQYVRASLEADRTLGLLADGLNLWTTTLIVTADHGHIDPGGHGGSEPEVLEVPLVMAGRGIREGFAGGAARQIDVAPTIASLLGLPIPGGSEGRPLVEALDTKEANLRGVEARALAQKTAFAREYLSAVGSSEPVPTVDGVAEPREAMDVLDGAVAKARASRIAEEQSRRLPLVALAASLSFLLAAWCVRGCGWRGFLVALGTAAASEGLFRLLAHLRGLQPSISGINHDDDLAAYFLGVTVLGGVAAVACVVAVLWSASRRSAPDDRRPALLALCAALGALAVPASVVALAYWHQGLDMTWRVGDIAERFAANVGLARLQAAGLVAALVPALGWLSRRGPWSGSSPS